MNENMKSEVLISPSPGALLISTGEAPALIVITAFNPLTNQAKTLGTVCQGQLSFVESFFLWLTGAPSGNISDRLSATLQPGPATPGRPGPKGKIVSIIAKDEDSMTAPRVGDQFENSVLLSELLSLPPYTVRLALNKAGGAPACVKGLHIKYTNDVTEAEQAAMEAAIESAPD